jgi:2-haloalkanoic acid dehalogenase type II
MQLSDYAALTFDCYGSLIDWESGIVGSLLPWLTSAGVHASRSEILNVFRQMQAAQQAATPTMLYPQLLAEVHGALAAYYHLPPNPEAARAFGASIRHWPAFSDAPGALAYLKEHFRLVILSNVDRASFAHSNKKLGIAFDAVLTAEDIGSYKPDPANFERLIEVVEAMGVRRDRMLHCAESLTRDLLPAKQHGLATCWVDRRRGQPGRTRGAPADLAVRPDFQFDSLGGLADAHWAEIGPT